MTAVQWLIDQLAPVAGQSWATVLVYLALSLATVLFVLAVAPGLVWGMRKVMGHIQHRTGPYRVGPFGLLQPVADGIKLVSKEDIMPEGADEFSWKLAVYVLPVPVFIVFLFMPWHPGFIVSDVSTGIILLLAVAAISPVGEIMAGWGSNNKYSILGGLRAAAMDVAYEVPLVLAAASVVILTGTMEMQAIVEAQEGMWFFVIQPIGLFIFLIAGLAKIGVAPVDLAEAESEFVAGFHTEYSGMRFGLLFLTLFANIILVAALTSILFLGGWQAPFGLFDGVWWFLLKTLVVAVFLLTTWFTLPRVRVDQFMNLGWKLLFPLALLNMVIAAVIAKGGFV
jgi:NADH-quinone oxidoreductase subunit H